MATDTVLRTDDRHGRRRDSRPLTRRRPSGGHLLMLVAGLLAAVLNIALLASANRTTPVAVAAVPLTAGQPLQRADLRFVEAGVAGAVAAALLGPDDDWAGAVVVSDLAEGTPLRRTDLRAPSSSDGRRAMSVPIDPAHAAGGDLAAGDRVDVIALDGGTARFVLADVEVLAVSAGDGGGLGLGQRFHLTLAVDGPQALRIAEALQGEGLEVVRATGADPLDRAAVSTVPAATEATGR